MCRAFYPLWLSDILAVVVGAFGRWYVRYIWCLDRRLLQEDVREPRMQCLRKLFRVTSRCAFCSQVGRHSSSTHRLGQSLEVHVE